MTDPKDSKPLTPRFFVLPPDPNTTGRQAAGISFSPAADWWKLAEQTWAEVLTNMFNTNTEAPILALEEYKRQIDNPLNLFGQTYHQAWEKHYHDKGESPGGELYQRFKFLFSGSGVMPEPLKGKINALLRGKQAVRLAKALGEAIPGAGVLYGEEYNGRFLHETGAGKVAAYDVDALVQQFADMRPGATLPHVVITSSHAQGETLQDVTSITRGIESLIHHSQGEERPIHTMENPPDGLKKPLILYACDTEKNPFLNAAALMNRLDVLEKTGGEGSFEHASPGARRIARLILKCMVQNPEVIPMDDARPLSEILSAPVTLRPNAERIAQHFHLIGYSKGGNVVSDAMRYLVGELTAQDKNSNPLIVFDAVTDEVIRLSPRARIHNLVRNIACASFAAIEVPMAQYYKDHGVRRFAVNNVYDQVADHKPYDSTPGDRRLVIEGTPEKSGHDPAAALGTRESKGYFLKDETVARRLKEWFAPMFGKAAISSIVFEDARMKASNNSILIGTAPGTPDELLMEYKETITEAMKNASLTNVKLATISHQNGRAFILTCRENIASEPQALKKLQKGFETLIRPDVKGLVIAEEILKTTIPHRLSSLGRSR
jgi:hypothetical protein